MNNEMVWCDMNHNFCMVCKRPHRTFKYLIPNPTIFSKGFYYYPVCFERWLSYYTCGHDCYWLSHVFFECLSLAGNNNPSLSVEMCWGSGYVSLNGFSWPFLIMVCFLPLQPSFSPNSLSQHSK